jgi:hypothetical protein
MKINLDLNEARRKEKTIAKERHDIYIYTASYSMWRCDQHA